MAGKLRKKNRLLFGVGINDADYPVEPRVGGKRVKCPYYVAWKGMLERCYDHKYQDRYPTYKSCSVCPEWISFMNFRKWMMTQDWQGKALDKDLLIEGNKVYSPESCVFVPKELNGFLTLNNAKRNGTLLGASWHKRDQHWRSRVMNPFTLQEERLGSFSTELEAHLAWKRRKHEIACMWADKQQDPRLSKALRTRFLPLNEVYIED